MADDPDLPRPAATPDDPTVSRMQPGASPPSAAISHPARIGRYTIVRVLGEGGMGTVFEARQENPRRTVALKVIRDGLLSAESLRRFGQESDVLARLQHPGIAQVYDAGSAADDRGHATPYFAMEFIHGEPLTVYARRLGLGTRERLELLARVCDAVEHAHQKGIIHRDLKPGNILVDASGQPRILDFGVARATDGDLQRTTIRTDIGQLVGTIPYMSPEQVSGDPAELDTRSDVYALGVITYELLAGRLPYDLHQKMLHEAVRVIRESEPDRLSSVDRTLRGDVETIVARALEKDKSRRYPSAESLGSDVRRYLRHEPITARPASTWYQIQKFSRRNQALVGGIVAAFVLLVAGLLGTGYGLRQALVARDAASAARADAVASAAAAKTERDRALAARDAEAAAKAVAEIERGNAVAAERAAAENARREAQARQEAEAINGFVTTSLGSSDPNSAGGRQDMTVLQAMRNATRDIAQGRFGTHPATEAGLVRTIAKIVLDNGDAAQAESLYRQSLATRRRLHAGDHPDVVASLSDLSMALIEQGHCDEAVPSAREALAMNQRLFRGDHPATANALNNMGAALFGQGKAAEAEPYLVRGLAMRRRLFTGDHPDVAESINNLAVVRQGLGRADEARPLYEQALAMNRRLHPGDHPKVANALNNLANTLLDQGRSHEAEQHLRDALAMRERLYRGDHPEIASTLNNLGLVLHDVGRVAEAESLFVRALHSYERLYPGDQPDKAWTLSNLCNVLVDAKRPQAAEPHARQALEMRRRLYPGDHPEVAHSEFGLANLLRSLKRGAEAEPLFRESLAMRQRLYPGDHPDVSYSLRFLASTIQGLGRAAEADSLYRVALAMNRRLHPGDHPSVALVLSNLAGCVAEEGRLQEALELARESAGMAARVLPAGHQGRANCERTLADLQARVAAGAGGGAATPGATPAGR